MADILARTRLLSGTKAQWASANIVIGNGEPVLETGVGAPLMKIGDGVKTYSQLNFWPGSAYYDLLVGAAGDGIANDTAIIQAAINSAASRGKGLFISAGNYLVDQLSLPPGFNNRVAIIGEPGTYLLANANGQVVLDIPGDSSRQGGRIVRDIQIKANGKTNVTGLRAADPADAILQLAVHNVTARDCFIGFDVGNVQESTFSDCVSNICDIGCAVSPDVTGGGATVVNFIGCKFQDSDVGFVLVNASPFALGAINFVGCLFQASTLCGFASGHSSAAPNSPGAIALNFNSCHFEANGLSAPDGTTLAFRSFNIRKAGVHLKRSRANFTACWLGEGLVSVDSVYAEDYSQVTVTDNVIAGGQKNQLIAKTGSQFSLLGSNEITGHHEGVKEWSGALFTGKGQGGYMVGPAISLEDTSITNESSEPFSEAPDLNDDGLGATVTQLISPLVGISSHVSFGAGAGNTGTNRVTLRALRTSIPTFTLFAMSMLIRADRAADLGWLFAGDSGQVVGGNIPVDTNLKLVKLYGVTQQLNPTGINLFMYPRLSGGLEIDVQNFMIATAAAGTDYFKVNEILRRGIFTNNAKTFFAPSVPTTGVWPRRTRVINSAPAVGAARGWTKVTLTSGNVLGTDWIADPNF